MGERLDRNRLQAAFQALGEHLADRGAFVELAVYGGSAIMLQFEWRLSTEDVDAIVREGYDEAALAEAVRDVAGPMGLDPNWLDNAVGMFTPLREDDAMFELAGSYPATSSPGLRILLARPHYLLAMKLRARALARHLDIADEDELRRLYVSIHDDQPPADARIRFRAVLGP